MTVEENNITRKRMKQVWSTMFAAKVHSLLRSLNSSLAFVCFTRLFTLSIKSDWESISLENRSSLVSAIGLLWHRLSFKSAHRSSNSFLRILDKESWRFSELRLNDCRVFVTWPLLRCSDDKPDCSLFTESLRMLSSLCCRKRSRSVEVKQRSLLSLDTLHVTCKQLHIPNKNCKQDYLTVHFRYIPQCISLYPIIHFGLTSVLSMKNFYCKRFYSYFKPS